MTTKFNSRYDHTRIPPEQLPYDGQPTRTKQEYLKEADINTILARYERQGIAPPAGDREPIYNDFTDPALSNYQEAMNQVIGVGELMERLPAKVRARFGNDPVNLIRFVQDKNNAEEAYRLGLLRADYKSPSAPPTPPSPPGKPE